MPGFLSTKYMYPQPLAASPQRNLSLAQDILVPLCRTTLLWAAISTNMQLGTEQLPVRQQSATVLNASIKSFILQWRDQNLVEERQKLQSHMVQIFEDPLSNILLKLYHYLPHESCKLPFQTRQQYLQNECFQELLQHVVYWFSLPILIWVALSQNALG